MENKQRTIQQNKALHLYFTHLSEALNDAGLDMRKTLKPEVEIPWTPENIKNLIWKPIMEAQLGKKSTTEMNTKDIDVVFDTINRHLGEKFGLEIRFPSIDSLILNEEMQNVS